jgi:hypothetical protein
MLERLGQMSSADFLSNNRDETVVMDPDIAKFFISGEIRRERLDRQKEVNFRIFYLPQVVK